METNNNLPQQNEDNNLRQDEDARFESDTQKLVKRHLEDPDHEISEEEMAALRVGMTPPVADDASRNRFDDEEAVDEAVKKHIGHEPNEDTNDRTDEGGQKMTPWDTIN